MCGEYNGIKKNKVRKFINSNLKISFLFFLISLPAQSQVLPVKISGFIDTYYAFDSNTPATNEREFTTQPVRHNEFNVNLAYIDAVVEKEKTRGRLALQFGNSVTRNYSSEPNTDLKVLQEAYVGRKIGDRTWIDMGIFLGNIGAESWISKDNWTYTRSLNLDYVPYYSSGVRLTHQIDNHQSFQIQILNGWQNITENNQGKALGMQYKNQFNDKMIFTYNNFFGDEEVVLNPKTEKFNSRFRAYHNFIFQFDYSDKWHFLGAFDVGHQSQQNNKGVDGWYNSTLTIKHVLNSEQSLSFRAEYYNDRHQANIMTGTKNGFEVIGASLNYDQKLDDTALWRTEIRGFHSKDEIYTQGRNNKNRNDGLFVTSLSIWF